jgi:hypothetical protein
MAGGLTVVGVPVVYACRLSGAPAGVTLLNQPAYEKITDPMRENLSIDEDLLDIKHEGKILTYRVKRNGKVYKPVMPNWLTPAE